MCTSLAWAQAATPEHWLRPSVDVTYARDANLFRTDTDPVPDRFRTITVGLVMERPISNQVINAHLNMSRAEFERNKNINYDAKDVGVTWNWQLGRHWHGNLGASSLERLNSFAESHFHERTLQTNRREFFNGVWLFHPQWQLQFGSTRNRYDFDLLRSQPLNRDVRSSDLGIDFLSGNGNRIGLLLVRSDAVFPVDEPGLPPKLNNYTQDDFKLRVDWNVTGKSQIRFEGGKTERSHVIFPIRDYNGFNARLIATWVPTAKQALTGNAWREIGAVDNLITSYTLNQGLSLDSVWAPTEKLRFDGHLAYEVRDFNNIGGFGNGRSDQYTTASLGMTYILFNRAQFGLSASREVLNSNQGLHSYRTNGVIANIRYQY